MNRLIIYFSIVFIGSCQAQSNIDYYKTAFEYIVKQENNGISLSDTIIPLALSTFYIEISNGNNSEKVLFGLDSVDNQRNFSRYKYSELNKISSNSGKDLKLYFSEVYKNMLIAELLPCKGGKDSNYDNLTSFNLSKQYLFIFDKDKTIINVYTKKIQYD
jgi:hypothetical protein